MIHCFALCELPVSSVPIGGTFYELQSHHLGDPISLLLVRQVGVFSYLLVSSFSTAAFGMKSVE